MKPKHWRIENGTTHNDLKVKTFSISPYESRLCLWNGKTGKDKKGIKKEATMGIEPMMRVLQTPALPLGHVAVKNKTDNVCYQS